MQCDCSLIEFLPYFQGHIVKGSHKYFKFSIDNVSCHNPDYMECIIIKKLDKQNFKCDWLLKNNTEVCYKKCNWWEFPKTKQIFSDCSHRNIT